MGGVSVFATDTKLCSPREGSAKPALDLAWLAPRRRGLGEKGGEIETGERMSMVGLDRLARRGSLITGGPSSSELIFSMPPGVMGGRGGGRGGGASNSSGGRGGAVMSLGGRGGGGVVGTGGRQLYQGGCDLKFIRNLEWSPGLCMVPVPCLSEAIPESRLEGVCGVGERREGDSVILVEGVVDPHRRCREDMGYSLVDEGARNVSPPLQLGLRPVGVMGMASESSVSDSLMSWVLSEIEVLRRWVGVASSASELTDLRGFRSSPHFFRIGSKYFFKWSPEKQ